MKTKMPGDDVEAMAESAVMFPPILVPTEYVMWDLTLEVENVDPVLMDIIMYGQSPGPQFPLGEN